MEQRPNLIQRLRDGGYLTPLAIALAGIAIAIGIYASKAAPAPAGAALSSSALEEAVAPSQGVVLPATWGNLGKQLVDLGVIDEPQFEAVYQGRGGLTAEGKQLLLGSGNGKLKMTRDNAGYLLNLLWALGLANQNEILADKNDMANPTYGSIANFASTGGWTIAKGSAMDHYNKHALLTLTPAQQALVDKVSKNIYRFSTPCRRGLAVPA